MGMSCSGKQHNGVPLLAYNKMPHLTNLLLLATGQWILKRLATKNGKNKKYISQGITC
jgi:hypothetical protein